MPITCPRCSRVSHNVNDEANRHCAVCGPHDDFPHLQFEVQFLDSGREPRVKPDPDFPDGKHIDAGHRPSCKLELPYPAIRCGMWLYRCRKCDTNGLISAAGRKDDARSVMIPCLEVKH